MAYYYIPLPGDHSGPVPYDSNEATVKLLIGLTSLILLYRALHRPTRSSMLAVIGIPLVFCVLGEGWFIMFVLDSMLLFVWGLVVTFFEVAFKSLAYVLAIFGSVYLFLVLIDWLNGRFT